MAGNEDAHKNSDENQKCVVVFKDISKDLTENEEINRNILSFDEIKVVRRKDEGQKSLFDHPDVKVNYLDCDLDLCQSELRRNFEDREISIANEDSGVDLEEKNSSNDFSNKNSSKFSKNKSDSSKNNADFSKKHSNFSKNSSEFSNSNSDDLEILKEAYEIIREGSKSPKNRKKRLRNPENSFSKKNLEENSPSSSQNCRKRRKNSTSSQSDEDCDPEINEIYTNYLNDVFPYYENFTQNSDFSMPSRSSKRRNFCRYRYRCRFAGYNRSIKKNLRETYAKNKSYLEYLRTNIAITAINAIKDITTKI